MAWGVLPWVYPVWDSLCFLDLGDCFLPHLGKFSTIISLSIFWWSFFLSSSYGTPMIQMLGHLTLPQRSLRLSSFLFILFSFFLLCFIYFYHSIFHLTYPLFSLSYSTVGSLQSVFDLIYYIIINWLFFISSRSLLNFSCIFSILVSRLFICNSNLFSTF